MWYSEIPQDVQAQVPRTHAQLVGMDLGHLPTGGQAEVQVGVVDAGGEADLDSGRHPRVELQDLQYMMGHTDPKITMQIYVEIRRFKDRKVASLIPAFEDAEVIPIGKKGDK